MKTRYNFLTMVLVCCVVNATLTSCDDYLDITPKGATLLDNFNDLELLAIGSYSNSSWEYDEMEVIVNDSYGRFNTFTTTLTQGNTVAAAELTYNEGIDRANLTESSSWYSGNYGAIASLNQVVNATPDVKASEAEKARLIAQARVKRAYFHYLMVIPFCKQYDATTAAQEGGIPYVTDINLGKQNEKLSLQETYDQMLADCTDDILAALPDEPTNVLLPGKAFGYAVRAKILLQMKNYSEALKYAEQSIRYNPAIEDRTAIVNDPFSFTLETTDVYNNFFTEALSNGYYSYYISAETAALFEEGDLLKDYAIYQQTDERTVYVWNWDDIVGLDDQVLCWKAGAMRRNNTGGITSEQMYYIAAECNIRTGNIAEGMRLVNEVRKYRIAPEQYQPLTATTEQEAMRAMQRCKRIECLFTYNTFADMKRWNTEDAYRQTITRQLAGQTYTLSPTSPLWVFPFPKEAVRFNSSLTQNY
ncbi:MAG: RagB/SusD family nutrient uptake outer membrane protein [Bacteroidaceae bacterium]|nr:RagB/SusD family nutrient uptake outer membrane protein [Bacteroidaceae bacterium]